MKTYFAKLYHARHFWTHLVLSDLRTKYRRSFLGLLWALVHPLSLTLLLGFVMSRFFHTSIAEYAPYILSGLILWEFIASSALNGSHAFINAEIYIRQFAHPLAIYSLRSTLACFINLLTASIGLLLWVLIAKPASLNLSLLSLPFSYLILFFMAWPFATITALLTLLFRDFSQMMTLILQAIWYVSPVYFLPSLFENAGIGWALSLNPIYHALELVRAPLLRGVFPTFANICVCGLTMSILTLLAVLLMKNCEKKVIFYL